jgi:uncharacterized membrane protein
MTRETRPNGLPDAWIAPGTALFFSLLIAIFAPRYRAWFGDTLPALTRGFLAYYPLWIAFSVIELVAQACAGALGRGGDERGTWSALDVLLGIASLLVIAVGIIALAMPVLLGPGSAI